MNNLWNLFRAVLPSDPVLVAQVMSHTTDGGSIVQTPAGASMRVRGQQVAVGSMAFIRAGVIESAAPTLPFYELEV